MSAESLGQIKTNESIKMQNAQLLTNLDALPTNVYVWETLEGWGDVIGLHCPPNKDFSEALFKPRVMRSVSMSYGPFLYNCC